MRRTKQRSKIYLPALLAILLIIPTLPILYNIVKGGIYPYITELLEKAAMTSLMVNAPEGTTKLIRDRFAYKEAPPNSIVISPPISKPIDDLVVSNDKEFNLPTSDIPVMEKLNPPDIEEKYRGSIVGESFSGTNNSAAQQYGDIYIRNYTKFTPVEISEILKTPAVLNIDPKSTQPQVLIYHTHATESFEGYDSPYYDTRGSWRTTDNNSNMVAVGNAMAEEMETGGINIIQNRTHHDYPSYNGSYQRSAETIEEYLKEYPSIKVVIDLHRDAMEREGNVIVKPITEIDGNKAAQVMVMTCYDPSIKNWKNNLRFAADLTDTMEVNNPGITRPIYLCDGKYNQGLANSALLIEVGSHANTVEEAIISAKEIGKSLSEVIKKDMAK